MITGVVNARREAILTITLRTLAGQEQSIDAVIDTGFNGSLTLPISLITNLGLPLYGQRRVILGDGSTRILDVYEVIVLWDGQPRNVLVNASGATPLVGMNLMYGYELTIQNVDGGSVTLVRMP